MVRDVRVSEARKHGEESQEGADNSLSPPASQPQPSQQNVSDPAALDSR
jgi:hypothetical protein